MIRARIWETESRFNEFNIFKEKNTIDKVKPIYCREVLSSSLMMRVSRLIRTRAVRNL